MQDLESFGFQMPQRTKRQVDKEQQASSRGTGGAHTAPKERLTHRKLRVIIGWDLILSAFSFLGVSDCPGVFRDPTNEVAYVW